MLTKADDGYVLAYRAVPIRLTDWGRRSGVETGPVEEAVRRSVAAGARLHTPARGAPFVVKRINQQGVVLALGVGEWDTPFSWSCLEGIVPLLAGRGWG